MRARDIRFVIERPMLTEKGAEMKELKNRYVFRVGRNANKREIKEAVEKMFNVKVKDVRTMNVPPKPKRRGWTRGTKPGWKKAIVQLREGDRIEIFEGAAV